MKYVHILGAGGMYTRDYCQMLADCFNPKEHCIISGQPEHANYRLVRDRGCCVFKTTSMDAIKHLRKCDCIIAHGMVNVKVLTLFYLWPNLLKKTNWVIWGGDIYDNSDSKQGLPARLICSMRKFVYPRVRWATSLSRRDYAYARKQYGLSAFEFEGCYPVPASTNSKLISDLRSNGGHGCNSGTKTIQVGNSATVSNQHIDALNELSRYKDEDIEVFLPLNYGPAGYEQYATHVIKHAEKLFGSNKVVALRDQVDGAAYLKMLAKVDVGVFNNNRQQAMGNISQLLLLGTKIYIRKDVSMWDHFDSLGCQLNSFESIRSQSFNEFIRYDKCQREANASIIEKRHAIEEKVRTWTYIFSEMERTANLARM